MLGVVGCRRVLGKHVWCRACLFVVVRSRGRRLRCVALRCVALRCVTLFVCLPTLKKCAGILAVRALTMCCMLWRGAFVRLSWPGRVVDVFCFFCVCLFVAARSATWSLDTFDYIRSSTEIIQATAAHIQAVAAGSAPASTIQLLHDREASTLEALPDLVTLIRGAGFSFVTMDQCLYV